MKHVWQHQNHTVLILHVTSLGMYMAHASERGNDSTCSQAEFGRTCSSLTVPIHPTLAVRSRIDLHLIART
jgi:hypothetical protein